MAKNAILNYQILQIPTRTVTKTIYLLYVLHCGIIVSINILMFNAYQKSELKAFDKTYISNKSTLERLAVFYTS